MGSIGKLCGSCGIGLFEDDVTVTFHKVCAEHDARIASNDRSRIEDLRLQHRCDQDECAEYRRTVARLERKVRGIAEENDTLRAEVSELKRLRAKEKRIAETQGRHSERLYEQHKDLKAQLAQAEKELIERENLVAQRLAEQARRKS